MPRRAPTEIVEQRITFGNYERQFVTDIKNDVEKGVKIAAITAAAVPVATVVGLGLLGYGIFKGGQLIGKGINEFSMLEWNGGGGSPTGVSWMDTSATEGYTEWQKIQLNIYIFSGGYFGLSHDAIRKQNAQA